MTTSEQNYHTNSAHLLGAIMGLTSTLRIYANDKEVLGKTLRELHALTEFGWACLHLDPADFRLSVYYAAVERAKVDGKGVKMLARIATYSDDYTVVFHCPNLPAIAGTFTTRTLKFAQKLIQFLEAETIDDFREACYREIVHDNVPATSVV